METKSFVAEFIGTFALVFIGAGAVLINSLTGGAVGLVGIALAHGIILMVMIYSFATVSGSHFNPAVTIGLLATKRIEVKKAIGYIVSQLLGATAAASFLLLLYPNATAAQLYGFPAVVPMGAGIAIEAILTFFLVTAVYGTAVNKKAPQGAFGLAIGGSLLASILMGGTQTGAALNPARAFGPALVSGMMSNQPIYWIGPIIGGLVAALLCEYVLKEEKSKKS